MRLGICLTVFYVTFVVCSRAQGVTLKTLYSFCSQMDCADGNEPSAGLLRDSSGNLFGTTFYGGTAPSFQGGGVAFELSPSHGSKWKFNNLHTFCTQSSCTDGEYPNGDLILDTSGNLYGEAVFGGDEMVGVIFKLSPAGAVWSYNILHSFSDPEGGNPAGGLRYKGFGTGSLYDGISPLYGVAQSFGPSGEGTVYKLAPDAGSWALSTIHSFDRTNGLPVQTVTPDTSGANMYGVTLIPFGAVFQLTDAGNGNWNETTLYTFDPAKGDDTYSPFGSLSLDPSGSLIGTTSSGGPHCKHTKHHGTKRCGGNVFKLSGEGSSPSYDVIHDFCAADKLCEDGSAANGALVMDRAGNIYGATGSGGKYGGGAIFRVRHGQKLEVIYSFCSLANCSDGNHPNGSLILDAKGHLYGTTAMGGANNGGTVFELVP